MKKILAGVLAAATLNAQAAPVLNIFELGIQAGQTAVYDEVGKNNITASVGSEQGTLAMYSAKRQDRPDIAYMIEIYQDEAAYQVHIQSAQYREFLRRSPEILTGHKRKIDVAPQFLGDKQVRQTDAAINNLVIVDVKPEYAQAFRNAVMPEMAQSLGAEEGVLAMYAATEKANPNRWYFYEIYADEAAYRKHRQTPHFQNYLTSTAAMLENKETVAIVPTLLQNKGGLLFSAP